MKHLLWGAGLTGFTTFATLTGACGSNSDSRGTFTSDASALFNDAGSEGGTGCAEAATYVYVVSADYDLYSFDPPSKVFKKIGRLNCPDPGQDVTDTTRTATPNSMAIDRSGTAWVNFSSGKLFKVSTGTAACQSTTYVPGQEGVFKYGMGFSSNAVKSEDETLFVAAFKDDAKGSVGQGLFKLDLGSFKLTRVGDFSGAMAGKAAELTGTGDAKLWGFYTTTPGTLAEIDKASGATPNPILMQTVNAGTAWAFSFWGGDFWFYTAEAQTSAVTQLKPKENNKTEVVVPDVGFRIVGAGVSTCAPLDAPK